MGPRTGGLLIRDQRGQAMVFSLLFLGVVLLGLVFLYKAGRLTSEKMQLQNAADAAAYSVSVIEARDLNFAAYTNRAMVANEVAIGQLVGLASWANHIQSVSYFLGLYIKAFSAMPGPGNAIANLLRPIKRGFNTIGRTAQKVTEKVGKTGIKVLHSINRAYSTSQMAFHVASLAQIVGTVYEMVEQNFRKDNASAKVSDFGTLSLLGHLGTYHTKFLRRNKRPRDFAAVVRESRDPFSTDRAGGVNWDLIPPRTLGGSAWGLISILVDLHISINRLGGTELRYTTGSPQAKDFGWSAADTTGLNLDFRIRVSAIDDFISGAGEIADGQLEITGCFLGDPDDDEDSPFCTSVSIGFPTSAPFSAGFAQVGTPKRYTQTTSSMKLDEQDGPVRDGKPDEERPDYGGAPRNRTAWYWPGKGVAAQAGKGRTNVQKGYKGLQPYLDSNPDAPGYGFQAPYLLLGVVKEMKDVDPKLPEHKGGSASEETDGTLELEDKAADEEVGVLAKSEIYFARPDDLSYLKRRDGRTELGNTFNPYWQARLVPTTDGERMAAMAIQQKTPWKDEAFRALSDFGDLMDKAFGA